MFGWGGAPPCGTPRSTKVLFIDAVLAAANMIVSMRGRSSAEGAAAENFLTWVGNEEYVQLAMLADASDEGTRLVRQLDCNDLDEGEVVWDCEQYLMILRSLFVDGQCLVAPGYTFYAIEALKKIRVTTAAGKTLGGWLDPEIITRALRRMAASVMMATSTIEAEFPGFELKSNFKVFTLGRSSELKLDNRNTANESIRKLAMAFNVDPAAAVEEYYTLLPFAIRAKTNSGQHMSNFDAWAHAVREISGRRPSTRGKFPVSNIVAILVRYCAWSTSTSEVERGFAVTTAVKGGSSEDFNCSRETDILTIMSECRDTSEWDMLIKEARWIWQKHYGIARTSSTRTRTNTGRSSRSGEYGTGEVAFVRLRRDAALAAAKAPVDLDALPHAVDLDSMELTDKQQTELAFQHRNTMKRKVMTLQAGHIDPEDVDPELEAAQADGLRFLFAPFKGYFASFYCVCISAPFSEILNPNP